jgi:catechol 2,3-dioxygenase-like lactoylglutathione lyase family enzyme
MVNGAHLLLYSSDAEADRPFFRDVLGMPNVDVGDGWLIFALPPAEMAVHPTEGTKLGIPHGGDDLASCALYLMCDDVNGVISTLTQKGVPCAPVTAAPWGLRTAIALPSGAKVGLDEPRHPKPPRS